MAAEIHIVLAKVNVLLMEIEFFKLDNGEVPVEKYISIERGKINGRLRQIFK